MNHHGSRQQQVIFYKTLFQAILQVILFEIQNGHLKRNVLKSGIENEKNKSELYASYLKCGKSA